MAQSWSSINRRRKLYERKYIRLWIAAYRDAGREVAALIDRDRENAAESVKFSQLETLWMDMYREVGTAFALDSRRMNAKSFNVRLSRKSTTVEEDILLDAWERRMVDYSLNEAGFLIESIKLTAKEEARRLIGDILQDAFVEGLSRDAMAESIASTFADEWGEAAGWMGRRVAQTEMIRASNYGTLEGIESLGVPYDRIWYAGGRNIRDTHIAAHNQRVDSEHPFNVGGHECWYPGDPSLPPEESINCKCAVSAIPKGGY